MRNKTVPHPDKFHNKLMQTRCYDIIYIFTHQHNYLFIDSINCTWFQVVFSIVGQNEFKIIMDSNSKRGRCALHRQIIVAQFFLLDILKYSRR